MRLLNVAVIVCVLTGPVLAGALPLDFVRTSAQVTIDLSPDGAGNPDPTVPKNLDGTFSLTIYSSDEFVGTSDTFTMEISTMTNQAAINTALLGVNTATIPAGSVTFSDFSLSEQGHIVGGNGSAVASAHLETTIFIIGEVYTTYSTIFDRSSIPLSVSFTTAGNTLTADVQYTMKWEIGITDLAATLTLDFIVNIAATAHVPEPALGSLVALGLGGAGVWLRRRRT